MDAELSEAVEVCVERLGWGRARWLAEHREADYRGTILAKAAQIRGLPRPAPRLSPAGGVAVRSYLISYVGYGQVGEWVGRGLEAQGVPVGFVPIQVCEMYAPLAPFLRDRRCEAPRPGSWVVQVGNPNTPPPDGFPAAAYTMWETDALPADAVAQLNRCRAVFVPNAWNAESFAASGVRVPVAVVPMGVDAGEGYVPRPWPVGRPFTFGMAGRMEHGGVRKGLNEGMAAFARAFDRGEPVRLEVKVLPDCVPSLRVPDDPRVRIVTRPMGSFEMAEWYAGLDCLFVPSKGEGWGMHSHQAMAVGRPLIAARYGGTAEFFDARFGWELPFDVRPADAYYHGHGRFAYPTEDGMVAALRAAYSDPGGCRRKGALAAARAAEFTWARTGRELYSGLAAVGAVPGPVSAAAAPPAHAAGRPSEGAVPCGWRRQFDGCCGPVDRCTAPGHPRNGLPVMTRECLDCVESGARPA